MIRRWLVRRHAEPERELADKEVAEQQLADAQQLRDEVAETAGRFVKHKNENGYGASVMASMQPKIFVLGRRLRTWPR